MMKKKQKRKKRSPAQIEKRKLDARAVYAAKELKKGNIVDPSKGRPIKAAKSRRSKSFPEARVPVVTIVTSVRGLPVEEDVQTSRENLVVGTGATKRKKKGLRGLEAQATRNAVAVKKYAAKVLAKTGRKVTPRSRKNLKSSTIGAVQVEDVQVEDAANASVVQKTWAEQHHGPAGFYVPSSQNLLCAESPPPCVNLPENGEEILPGQEIPLSQAANTPSPSPSEAKRNKKREKVVKRDLERATERAATTSHMQAMNKKGFKTYGTLRGPRDPTWKTTCSQIPACTTFTNSSTNTCCCKFMTGTAPFPGLPCGTPIVYGNLAKVGVFIGAVRPGRTVALTTVKEWSSFDKKKH